jgi:hemolysin activation/secretion protein
VIDQSGYLVAVVTSLLAADPGPAQVQAQPNPPPPPSREEIERSNVPRQPRAPRAQVEARNALQSEPCPLRDSDVRANITAVDFTGPDGAELAPAIRSLLAGVQAPPGERPIAVVCDIRDDATARLRSQGYIAAVQIPPQRIETGHLRLEVVTGHLVEVHMRGDAPPFRAELAARAEQLKALNPFNQFEAERILLLASDIPGVEVRLTLAPARTKPGELIGELSVYYQPFKILGNVNNFGSRALGRTSAYARGEIYGLTGAADMTYLAASTTADFHEQQVVQLGHSMALGNSGLGLGTDFAYAWSRPDLHDIDPNDLLNLHSNSLIARAYATMPLMRARRTSLNVRGGLELLQQRTHSSFGLITDDKLRVAFLRAEMGFREPLMNGGDAYSLHGALELRKGLDIFDASNRYSTLASRSEGDPTAFVVRGSAGGVARLPSVFSVALDAEAQWANHPLLNFEEYSVGNYTVGRGYDPGAVTADRAIALRPEIRAQVLQKPRASVQLFGFYDNVWVWNLDRFSTEHGRSVASVGGGVRAVIAPYFLVEATYAKPLDRPFPDGPRPPARFLLSLTGLFSPVR